MLSLTKPLPTTHLPIGIYVHVPFCQTKCHYCDFYSVATSPLRHKYVEAVCRELTLRAKEWGSGVRTIYFGGGTPSQLCAEELQQIMHCIELNYDCTALDEVTLEVNPDDVSLHYLQAVRSMGFNRLSMGIQSLDDTMLRFLNRRHTAAQARQAVATARQAGFHNVSIDLMFGLPTQTLASWDATLTEAFALGAQHISAYHLSYEEGTPLHRMLTQGTVRSLDEELSLQLFRLLMQRMQQAHYHQYEISNYALQGFEAQHNSAYWDGSPYLGVGPAAHSFDGHNRYHNPDSLNEYITALHQGGTVAQVEQLSCNERYNDFIITALRQNKGMDIDTLQTRFGSDFASYCLLQATPHIAQGNLILTDRRLRLTQEGILLSDAVFVDLIRTEND